MLAATPARRSGYHLASNGRVDVHKLMNVLKEHVGVLTLVLLVVIHACSCNSGYHLASDGQTCYAC